ncbi:MAG: prepilin-type N-terminal cleavage/methylation domain-containing protein [Comamonas sp.]
MRRQHGFTLVEVMVAVAILAVIGSMSWLGVDALLRSQARNSAQSERTGEVQIALGQWSADVDQAVQLHGAEPMGWDGKVFRLTRRSSSAQQGVVVVAWAVRSDGQVERLMRWQSRLATTGAQWRAAWEEAAQWARGGALGSPAMLLVSSGMDIMEWSSSGAWVNGQSTRGNVSNPRKTGGSVNAANGNQPAGVRLIVHMPQGVLRKDWVNPSFSVGRS